MGDSPAAAKTQEVAEANTVEAPAAMASGPEGMSAGGPVGHLATIHPSDVVALQRRAGNKAVNSIMRPSDGRRLKAHRQVGRIVAQQRGPAGRGPSTNAVQRNGGYYPNPRTDEELIQEAIDKQDVGLIKMVKNLGKAKGEQKMPLITILNHQGWIGPFDEYALETLWGSFGDKVLEVAAKNSGEWELSLKGGAELYKLPVAKPLADKFIVDTRHVANSYLDTNEEYATKELAKLGVKEGGDGGAAGVPSQEEQNARLTELSAAIRVTKEARDVRNGLKGIVVGLERRYFMPTDKTVYWPMTFNPDAAPAPTDANPPPDRDEKARAAGVTPENLARTPWKDVKAQWDVLTAIMTGLSIAYPVAGVGLMSSEKQMGEAASEDPKAAKAAIVSMLTTTRDSIRGSRPKVAGGLAYELSPIHQQLFGGTQGKSGIDWKDPIAQALAKEVLELKSNVEFWKSMGLATLAAAAFIIAEFATAGLATAALVGFGVGLGVGQAAVAWDKALTMAEAEKATTGGGTELLASGQASMAMFEAALATVLVFVDAFQAAKPLGRALSGAVDKAALAAGTKVGGKVLEEIAALAGKAPDKALVERAVTELGAEAVMARTGKNAAELLAIVGENSTIAARLKTLAAIPAELAKLTPAELAKRASNLAAEVQANPATGEALAVLAVERMGPRKVLEMNGGWKGLSLALGNESAAGKSIMSWRDAFMGDIEAFVRTLEGGVDETGKAAVKRTGSQGKFTNDFDVSLLGPNASKNRNAVRSFMAGRVGTSPDRLGEMLLADFFTDPRRLHLYDQLDPALRAEVGTRAEKVAESTIMAKTLHDAEEAGNKELAAQIRDQMKALGVEEVPFKPLAEGDRAALYGKIDDYHMQLEQALKSGDKTVQKSLVEKIGDTQGLINATEGGGYFSGGATRQIVTLAEGLMKGATKPLDAQVYTTLLDQLPKLNSEASALLKSGIVASEEAVASIKGIAKYGKRFRDLMSKLDVKVADEAAWDNLAERLNTLLKQAKGEADVTLLARLETEAKAVESEVAALLGEFRGASQQVLMTLSRQAAIGGARVDLGAIQFLVMATAKLSRASNAVRQSLRAITAQMAEAALAAGRAATAPSPEPIPGTTPGTAPAPGPAGAVQPKRVGGSTRRVQRITDEALGAQAGSNEPPGPVTSRRPAMEMGSLGRPISAGPTPSETLAGPAAGTADTSVQRLTRQSRDHRQVQRHNPVGLDPAATFAAAAGAPGLPVPAGATTATPGGSSRPAPPSSAVPTAAATGPTVAPPLPKPAVESGAAMRIVKGSFGGLRQIAPFEVVALPLNDVQAAYARDCNERGAKKKDKDGSERAWTAADAKHVAGFADDRNKKIYVSTDLPVLGHVHELLHMNTASGFRSMVGELLNEGMTDHLAVRACKNAGIANYGPPGYVQGMGIASRLIDSVGEHVLEQAYFNDPTILKRRLDEMQGEGTWDRLKTAMDKNDTAVIEELTKAPSPDVKIHQIDDLLGGFWNWVSDEDVERVISIVDSARDDTERRKLQATVQGHLRELSSMSQRQRLRVGCNLL